MPVLDPPYTIGGRTYLAPLRVSPTERKPPAFFTFVYPAPAAPRPRAATGRRRRRNTRSARFCPGAARSPRRPRPRRVAHAQRYVQRVRQRPVRLELARAAHVDERRGLEQRLPALVKGDVGLGSFGMSACVRLYSTRAPASSSPLVRRCLELSDALLSAASQEEALPLYQQPPFTMRLRIYKQL